MCLSENHKRLEEYINPGSAQKVRILGYPRTDVLVGGNYNLPQEFSAEISNYSKLFVWLPTYRSHKGVAHADCGQDRYDLLSPESLQIINAALAASNSVMVVKFHPAQQLSKINVQGLSNVLVFGDGEFTAAGLRLYDLLAKSDALITDFSSVLQIICFAISLLRLIFPILMLKATACEALLLTILCNICPART